MIYETGERERAAQLFDGWQETMIWSCLQGVMGSLYVDQTNNPSSAGVRLGDFCFLAGEPKREIVLRGKRACRGLRGKAHYRVFMEGTVSELGCAVSLVCGAGKKARVSF